MTTAIAEPKSRRTYTPEERADCLAIYAACEGRAEVAAKVFKELDMGYVNVRTVQHWAYQAHPEDYQRIRAEVEAQTRSRRTDKYAAFADQALDAGNEAIEQVREALAEGRITPKELPRAVSELIRAATTATEEAETLAGKREAAPPVSFTVLVQELNTVPGVKIHNLPPAPALPAPASPPEGA